MLCLQRLRVLVVLGLAEMELIFPAAALMVPYFTLVARKVLITQQGLGHC